MRTLFRRRGIGRNHRTRTICVADLPKQNVFSVQRQLDRGSVVPPSVIEFAVHNNHQGSTGCRPIMRLFGGIQTTGDTAPIV